LRAVVGVHLLLDGGGHGVIGGPVARPTVGQFAEWLSGES